MVKHLVAQLVLALSMVNLSKQFLLKYQSERNIISDITKEEKKNQKIKDVILEQRQIICPQFSIFDKWSKGCQCKTGYQLDKQKKCIPVCPKGQKFDGKQSKKCMRICKWNQIHQGNLNKCLLCPAYSLYNEAQSICKCIPGYVNINDECYLKCGVNQIRKDNYCICSQGKQRINGICSSPKREKDGTGTIQFELQKLQHKQRKNYLQNNSKISSNY